MLTKKSRFLATVAICLSSLFAVGYGGGCYNLATTSAMRSIVPCKIFDCTGGLLNGAINPCNPNNPVLVGCP
jgi:hypothetical protein